MREKVTFFDFLCMYSKMNEKIEELLKSYDAHIAETTLRKIAHEIKEEIFIYVTGM